MSKIEEISKDVVAYTVKKLNDQNLPVDEKTTLTIAYYILDNFQKNLDFHDQKKKNYKKIIAFLEPHCEISQS